MSPRPPSGRRNAGVIAASAVALGLLFLYPTSTDRGVRRVPGQTLVPVGVVPAAPAPSASTPGPAPAGGPSTAPATVSTTVNGRPADTPYGPVQVQLVIQGGRIVRANAIVYPQGTGRDQSINGYAIPVLQQETVTAQGSRIDAVSGATYTSQGYLGSLQSALDAAHLR